MNFREPSDYYDDFFIVEDEPCKLCDKKEYEDIPKGFSYNDCHLGLQALVKGLYETGSISDIEDALSNVLNFFEMKLPADLPKVEQVVEGVNWLEEFSKIVKR